MSAEVTRGVLEHHLGALVAGDVEGLMQDYTDTSMIISNLGGVVKGLDAIRSMFAAGADMKAWEHLVTHVEDEVAYIAWKVDGVVDGTDTYVVRDGKIALQTFYVLFAPAAGGP